MHKHIPIVDFRIPNNKKGQQCITMMRKYINRERYGTLCTRPRGNRVNGSYDSIREGCPTLAVYLRDSDAERAASHKDRDRWIEYGAGQARSGCLDRIAEMTLEHEIVVEDLKHVQEGNECMLKLAYETHDDTITAHAAFNEIQAKQYGDLINKLWNWQIGAMAAFLGGLALGMTAVGMAYTAGM